PAVPLRDAEPQAVAGVPRLRPPALVLRAHGRVDSIRSDEQIAPLLAAVGQPHGNAVGALLEARHLGAEPQRVLTGRVDEYALEAHTADPDRRRAELAADVADGPRSKLRAVRRPPLEALERNAGRSDRVDDPDPLERTRRVAPEDHAAAELDHLRILPALEDGDLVAGAAQRDRGGEAADARSDDQRPLRHRRRVSHAPPRPIHPAT